MKIISVKTLEIPEILVIKFARFCDQRGYFAEQFRRSDLNEHPDTKFMRDIEFVQSSESLSHPRTIRGMHFQWNPYMGKMIRTLRGRMVDLAIDIRKNSPTFGKMIAYDMPNDPESDFSEWLWIPPGFGHGNYFTEETQIEYLCSGEYSQGCEAGISPFASDIDWSMCDVNLKRVFDSIASEMPLVTDKDKKSFSLSAWLRDERSDNFIYGKL